MARSSRSSASPLRRLHINPERIGQPLRRLTAIAVVEVPHRCLDVGVVHPRLDLHYVRARNSEGAICVPEVVEAKTAKARGPLSVLMASTEPVVIEPAAADLRENEIVVPDEMLSPTDNR